MRKTILIPTTIVALLIASIVPLALYFSGIIGNDFKTFTISFDENGGSEVEDLSARYNTKIKPPVSPTKDHYTFKGWYESEEFKTPYVFSLMPAKDFTLYASWTKDSYTLTFDSKGGSEVPSISKTYEDPIIKPTDPTKEGYTFAGWYEDEEYKDAFLFTSMPGENKTLYAKWTVNPYTISFDSKGGSEVASITKDFNETITSPIDPTKTGYTFKGWYKEDTFINKYEFSTMPAKDLTLFAKWEINSYKFTFNSNGGSAVSDIELNYNEEITKPSDPTKTGYTFNGWYKEEDFVNKYTIPSTMPAENLNLYAKWTINTYTISFETNGGSEVASISEEYNKTITAPTDPTKTGYTFKGWYKEADFSNKYTFSTMPASNLTLYAKWEINSYTITFDSNGGSAVNSLTADYNSKISAPEAPTLQGYDFKGWFKEDTLTNKFIFDKMPAENITLYAKFEKATFTITFDTNGGSEVKALATTYGDSISAPKDPTKTGYTFMGWFKDEALLESYEVPSTMPASSTTVYAKWKVNSYTISFNSNSGSEVTSITQDYGTSLTKPSDPTKSGYTFMGWFKDEKLLQAYTIPTTMPAENLTLYAKWEINKYTITFNSNGGSEVTTINKDFNEDIVSPSNPTKTGYTFEGWFKDEKLSEPYTIPSKMPASSFTVYAKWKVNKYTLTFDTNGGNTISPITQDYGTDLTAPTDPTKTGYTFKGWFKDNNTFKEAYEVPGTMPATSLTIYAKWEVNSYTITFDSNGGSAVTSINENYNETISAPKDPTKTGYTFVGWFKDLSSSEAYSIPTNMPAENITLYAKWSINSYSITFKTDGGSEVSTITKDYGENISAPTDPTKTGYTFKGWFKEKDCINAYTIPTTMPAESVTVYAKWKANKYTITFDSNGGSAVASITQDYGTSVTKPTDPTLDKYEFGGWYSDETLNNPYSFSTMPAENITLYAKWKVTNRTITFYSNGGSQVASITTTPGSSISAPTNPTKIGYTFGGWYSDETLNNPYSFSTMPAENINLYAKWNEIPIDFVYTNNAYKASRVKIEHNTYKTIDIPATFNDGINGVHNVTEIGDNFAQFSEAEEFKLPNTITMISNTAFSNNKYIKKINIPSSVKELKANSFNQCTNLQTITLSEGLETIGSGCFNVTGLDCDLVIPSTVISIGEKGFRSCPRLTVTFKPRTRMISINNYAFQSINELDVTLDIYVELGKDVFGGSLGYIKCATKAQYDAAMKGNFENKYGISML